MDKPSPMSAAGCSPMVVSIDKLSGTGSPMTAAGILNYRHYRAVSASPEYIEKLSVIAKDPLGAALQMYNVYRLEHKRPRSVAVIHLNRGKKAIRVERKGNELTVYYLRGDPETAVRRLKKKRSPK